MTRRRALVVYAANEWPLRTAVADHLLSFSKDPGLEAVYHNALRRPVPTWLARGNWAVVIFHTTFLAQRWQPDVFRRVRHNVESLRAIDSTKIAIPQDEFLNTDALCDFLETFGVGHVLTCARESEWPKIYGRLHPQPSLRTVLTGYLEPETIQRIDRLASGRPLERQMDVGYRAWRAQPWLGRHGVLKTNIASAVAAAARAHGLDTDISLDEADTIVGDGWLRFLLNCRWTLGVEGGASILDADGSVKACTERHLDRNPGASFEEVEAACFPGRDGELSLFAASPRHLEACATRTAQILVRGDYNGILKPDVHYLALEPDFSNLDAVLEAARDEGRRRAMTDAAYADVVATGSHSYRRFTAELVAALPPPRPRDAAPAAGARVRSILATQWDALDRVLLRLRAPAKRGLAAVGLLGLLRGARARMRRAQGEQP